MTATWKVRQLAAVAVAVCAANVWVPLTAAAAEIFVVLDQARLVKLPESVATLVIGNPLIADATLVAGNAMVITGKGYGATNVIALDRAGVELVRHSFQVVGPDGRDVVVVYRGADRSTYSCAPLCEPRMTLGDAEFAIETVQLPSTRGVASGGGAASGGGVASVGGGPCNNPDDIAADGKRCGARAASIRPGGR